MHGDTWPKVADHVGTHTVLECITHFLQLPIEDDFLDELEKRAAQPPGSGGVGGEGGGAAQQGEAADSRIGRVPLAGSEGVAANPVLSLVSGMPGSGEGLTRCIAVRLRASTPMLIAECLSFLSNWI
jgi:hypothetical protein